MLRRLVSSRSASEKSLLRQVLNRQQMSTSSIPNSPNFGPSVASKAPGTEGKPAQRTPWPMTDRNKFFAMHAEENASGTKDSEKAMPRESAKQAMDSIINDLKDLKQQNPGMQLDFKGKEMVLRLTNHPTVCLFRLVLQGEDELGFESSSSPGFVRTYKMNEYGQWNCVGDGHNLHGLFVRDILPYVKGMPKFANR